MTLSTEEIAFYTGIATILSGVFTITIKAVLRSNCVRVTCCCLECSREPTTNPKDFDIEMFPVNGMGITH